LSIQQEINDNFIHLIENRSLEQLDTIQEISITDSLTPELAKGENGRESVELSEFKSK